MGTGLLFLNAALNYLSPEKLKQILKSTGIPQTGSKTGNIGPLPDMKAAIEAVSALAVKNFEPADFILFLNPAQDKVTIIGNKLSTLAKIEMINSVGQIIYSRNITTGHRINIENFLSGIYYMRLLDQGGVCVKKLIKK